MVANRIGWKHPATRTDRRPDRCSILQRTEHRGEPVQRRPDRLLTLCVQPIRQRQLLLPFRQDPPNTLRADTVLKASEAPYANTVDFVGVRVRWGDYSHTTVDPLNDTDLW